MQQLHPFKISTPSNKIQIHLILKRGCDIHSYVYQSQFYRLVQQTAALKLHKPVASLAGFITLPDVSPFTAGSVYVTSRTTVVGNSTEIAFSS